MCSRWALIGVGGVPWGGAVVETHTRYDGSHFGEVCLVRFEMWVLVLRVSLGGKCSVCLCLWFVVVVVVVV